GLEASLFSADFPAQLAEAPEEAGPPAEAAELVDDDVDGQPIAAAEACLLAKYPLQLREQIHQWCRLDRSELEKLCLQRGVAARGGGGSAGCAIDRLACSEYYLQLKTEAEDAPLQLSSMGQAAALRAAAGDADALSTFWSSSLAPLGSKASAEGGGGEAGQDALAEGPSGERGVAEETPGTLDRRDSDRGDSEKEEVKSDSSDDIFDLPEEEEKSFEDERDKETEKESEKEEKRAAMDRMKMRQVELQVTQLQVELEKKGPEKRDTWKAVQESFSRSAECKPHNRAPHNVISAPAVAFFTDSTRGNGKARSGRLRNLPPIVPFLSALQLSAEMVEGWGTKEAFGSVQGMSICDKKVDVE
ncbi:RNA recognition motif-containing protein, partial [Toxoplasma gondii MAS]